ncbi:MAG: AAA family ATPase [Deltaproteobacteria bacterium HGW-Deltaproteobacteria-1]|jgi:predicted ATPase|nr:MAG: AAA family ATPase [Deltaproteobacteria bacterium HGW-Deltaproteobacteria-1]
MGMSSEMRRLENKWNTRGIGSAWPKFLDYIDINGLRGWHGQRIEFPFPIVAIVGENGSGKSTILQAASSIYKSPNVNRFASDYFPDTTWDKITNIIINYSYREGQKSQTKSIRKPTDRWRGNPDRPTRYVDYIDLSRIQPISARMGYRKLANPTLKEKEAKPFEKSALDRYSNILGRQYESARMALTEADSHKKIPVVCAKDGVVYSGFHHGAGEVTIAELLQVDPKQNSLMLIDEIESSLHPRAQRRLIRDLAEKCRQLDLQIILTTHSPYILEELPLNGRLYIINEEEKTVVRGVSPEFAMTKMDEETYPECDVYVEDRRSAALLTEMLARYSKESVLRCGFISFGSAQVGCSLGQMIVKHCFPRPSCVFLDGDQAPADGCNILPGEDAPERVVFTGLEIKKWEGVAERIGRPYSEVADACKKAMAANDHKSWVRLVADTIVVGSDSLWEALCFCWVASVFPSDDARKTIRPIEDCLTSIVTTSSNVQRRLF